MKKSVLFTSLLVLSSLALAACGGGSDDKGASNGGSDKIKDYDMFTLMSYTGA